MRARGLSNGQPLDDQTIQMFANRVGVLTSKRRKGTDRAGFRLVDQHIKDAGTCC